MAKKVTKQLQRNQETGMAYLLIAFGAMAAGVVFASEFIVQTDFSRLLGYSLIIFGAVSLGISISYNLKTVKAKKK